MTWHRSIPGARAIRSPSSKDRTTLATVPPNGPGTRVVVCCAEWHGNLQGNPVPFELGTSLYGDPAAGLRGESPAGFDEQPGAECEYWPAAGACPPDLESAPEVTAGAKSKREQRRCARASHAAGGGRPRAVACEAGAGADRAGVSAVQKNPRFGRSRAAASMISLAVCSASAASPTLAFSVG